MQAISRQKGNINQHNGGIMSSHEYAPTPEYVAELRAALPGMHAVANFLSGLSWRAAGPPATVTTTDLREASERLHKAGRIIQQGLDDILPRDQRMIIGSGAEKLRPPTKWTQAEALCPGHPPHIIVNSDIEKTIIRDGELVPMVEDAVRVLRKLAAVRVTNAADRADETLPEAAQERMAILQDTVLPLLRKQEELNKAMLQQDVRDARFRDIGPVLAAEADKERRDPKAYREHLKGLYADAKARDRADQYLGKIEEEAFSKREERKNWQRGYPSSLDKS
jgi:hypothetical protein